MNDIIIRRDKEKDTYIILSDSNKYNKQEKLSKTQRQNLEKDYNVIEVKHPYGD